MPRRPLVPLVAATCAGTAAWCSIGALGVGAGGSSIARLGLLPSWWLLLALVGGAVILAWTTKLTAKTASPLLVSGLLILPWLPGPIPAALFVWTGPMTVLVWTAAAVGSLAARGVRLEGRWLVDPARAPRLAAVVACLLFMMSAWWLSDLLPGSDEPHYLVITQSLLRDHDLQIENNHARGDHLAYFRGALKPDYLCRGANGQIYSIHSPGLSALVAPAYALFGYPGVVVFLSIVAAIGTGLLWRASYLLAGSASAAWFGWASGALTAPFFFHAFAVFPDGVAATLVLFAAMPLLEGIAQKGQVAWPEFVEGRKGWVATGTALAVLPWLHTRFAVASVALAVCLLLRLVRSPGGLRSALLLLSVPVASAVAWFSYFRLIYGTFNPAAPYGGYTQSSLANILNGLPALLFDQQFGVVSNAPVYGVCFVGLFALARSRRRLVIEISVIVASYLLAVAAYYMWWAGRSAPGRFAVPVLLLSVLPGAWLWQHARLAATRALVLAALGQSLVTTVILAVPERGRLAFNDRDGFALSLEWFNQLVDLPRGLPSFFRQTSGAALVRVGVWVVAIAAAWLTLRAIERSRRSHRSHDDASLARHAVAAATPLCLAVAIMVAFTSVWTLDRVRAITPESSQLDLLQHYEERIRPGGFDFMARQLVGAQGILARIKVATSLRRPLPPDPPLLLAGEVPAGRYRVALPPGSVASGTANLTIGRRSSPIRTWDLPVMVAGDAADLDLPVGVESIEILGDAKARLTGSRLELQPLQIFSNGSRIAGNVALRAARYGTAIVYFLDDHGYMEPTGFWIAGGAGSRVVVEPGTRSRTLRLFVRNAPVPNRLILDANGRTEEIGLQPGEERMVDVPRTGDEGTLLIRFHTDRGFTPALVEPGSTDQRFLGCWIEPRD